MNLSKANNGEYQWPLQSLDHKIFQTTDTLGLPRKFVKTYLAVSTSYPAKCY